MSIFIEKSDSSAAQTRALAAALHRRHFAPFNLNFSQRTFMRTLSFMPRNVIASGINLTMLRTSVPQRMAEKITTSELTQWGADLYPDDYICNTIILGAPNGGVSHIGTIMDAPFLTSHFLICFRHIKNVDDIYSTFHRGKHLAAAITRKNHDLHAINHYDPIHDRPALAYINHVRLKLIELPSVYKNFIAERLKPNGALVLINCCYPWLQYRVAPRVSFQVGGLGGITDEEFLNGSTRIDEYCYHHGSRTRGGWHLRTSRYALTRMPESEWGALPEFADAVKDFATASGIRLVTLTADHPEKFGELSFHLHRLASDKDSETPLYVFVDCFNQLDPFANIQSRLLPLWLPYYDENSYRFAQKMVKLVHPDTRFLFTMHPSYSDPFDLVPLDKWTELFTLEQPPLLFGVNPSRFPYDISWVYRFGTEIKNWSKVHSDPVRSRISVDEMVAVAKKIGIQISDR
ncbi:MAG: hypothetical protein AB1546_16005 [bacterium]